MSSLDLYLVKGGRFSRDEKLIDFYTQDNVPVYNITSVSNFNFALSNSGSVFITSFPLTGINLYNRDLGRAVDLDLGALVGTSISSVFDTNTRFNNTVSGAIAGDSR